jgi:hypothetical protein
MAGSAYDISMMSGMLVRVARNCPFLSVWRGTAESAETLCGAAAQSRVPVIVSRKLFTAASNRHTPRRSKQLISTSDVPEGAGNFPGKKRFFPARLASFLGNARSARMTSSSSSIKKGLCRRSLLKCVPVIAGAVISTTGMAESLFAQTKLTHEAVKYQDNPKDDQQCSGCVQFVAPASCKVVEDPVAASGWCQLFTAKPA